ncbi:monoamine oxidase [Agromyces flavus]|uniref:Monoamine oxidase n=1 Tax=Agromyces flavus TaxID=589382 RepID=A0A1H1ZPI4_9MICO|nr:hypothetical protein [Agromyces flavus]MCP2367175.1 monoamine oxidase [Agromyces flavus]GGI46253.1 hypothetical protein GCM10010932_13670 [Agromyces flavus]SDT35146.1 hypothetical protein SAMN04489721_3254 [Agromyces flavus]
MTDATNGPGPGVEDLDDRVEQAIGEAKAAADRAAGEADDALDAMRSAAADAADRGAAAVADAASQARALAEDTLDDAEDLLEDAAEWVEEKYRENPGLVLALAAAAGIVLLVGVGAVVRAIFRR